MLDEIFATTKHNKNVQFQFIIKIRASSNLVAESYLRLAMQCIGGRKTGIAEVGGRPLGKSVTSFSPPEHIALSALERHHLHDRSSLYHLPPTMNTKRRIINSESRILARLEPWSIFDSDAMPMFVFYSSDAMSMVLNGWNAQETHLYQIKNICDQSVLILNEIQVALPF